MERHKGSCKPLSKRLKAIYDCVPLHSGLTADIGTDHGYLAVALATTGKSSYVVASDINRGPLNAAKEYVDALQLGDKIDCRLGNGLGVLLPHEADTVLLCGMGGYLIKALLLEAPYEPCVLVSQPQNGQDVLKQYIVHRGYYIEREELVEDMGHLYEIWLCRKDEKIRQCYDEIHVDSPLWLIGALLFVKGHPLMEKRLQKLIHMENHVLHRMGWELHEHREYKEAVERKRKWEVLYERYCAKHHR